jgi:tetratricopeptide (TPR) repeat protein
MRYLVLALVLLAAVRPAFAQRMCWNGTPPPCPQPPAESPRGQPLRQRPFTIVAALDGNAPAEVRAAAKNLITSALDESREIAALPDDQIRQGLRMAGRPETTRVDVATARELATRGAIRTVVTGTIDQVGQTYHAAVRVLDADSSRVVAARSAIARGEDDLIPTLDRVLQLVRSDLGEVRTAIASNRRLAEAATPSFEAYQQYRRGIELNMAGNSPASADAYKRALALDTGFAAAWRGLAAVYFNIGYPDSGWAAADSALARPGRLVPWMRLYAEGLRASRTGETTVDTYLEAFRLRGGSPINAGDALTNRGRSAEAVALYEAWERSAPFGLTPLEQNNFVEALLPLGRFEEARRRAASVPGDLGTRDRLWVATWTADWPAAESLATELLARRPRYLWRLEATVAKASVAAVRGRMRDALDVLGTLDPASRHQMQLVLHVATRTSVRASDFGALPPDSAPYEELTRALWDIEAGDTAAARTIFSRVQGLPPAQRARTDANITIVEARLEAAAGRPAEAVRLLLPLTQRGTLDKWGLTQQMRWMLANAYERLGQPDSAAAQLERLAAWQGASKVDANQRGLTDSFARQRLVLLYSRMGRLADARRHWRVFSETFTTPDPEMVHLVDEARAAVASAERRP